MVRSLNSVARTPAGFAAIKSVLDLKQEDHTPSFFLAETLKYLYLLFDDDNFANVHAASFVFSTEGHLIPLALPPPPPATSPSPSPPPLEPLPHGVPIDTLPVGRLRQIIAASGLSHADCFEISELRERAGTATDLLVARQKMSVARQLRTAPRGTREPESDELVCHVGPMPPGTPSPPSPPAPPPSPPPPPKACHKHDKKEGSVCQRDTECGVDGQSCRRRRCSAHGYCYSPERS